MQRILTPVLLTVCFVLVASGTVYTPPRVSLPPVPPRDAEAWVQQVLDTLSLEARVGQMIATNANGVFTSVDDPAFKRLVELIDRVQIGGVITFRGYPLEQLVLLNELQRRSPLPLLMAQDMEWGAGMRLSGATTFPRAMALGATRDTLLAYAMGRVVAREARALGIHQNYAPTADVNNNPDNPIINVRSFGEDPELVGRMASAYLQGMQESGLIATAKHFPGHGDTHTDSHSHLPVLPFNRERLDTLELIPFRAAIARGVKSIMVGHLALPELEPDGNDRLPATLSPEITTRLLRKELGFEGLIVTDAMNMQGVVRYYGIGEAAVRAIEAGADMILMNQDEVATRNAILRAVREGRISEARIDSSVARILSLKAWAGLHRHRTVDPARTLQHVHLARHQALSEAIARRSITLLRNAGNLLPLPQRPLRILQVTMSDDEDPNTGSYLNNLLRKAHREYTIRHRLLDRRSSAEDFRRVLEEASSYDVIIIPTYVYVRSGSNRLSLTQRQQRVLERLLAGRTPTIVMAFGDPYVIARLKHLPDAYLATYSGSGASQRAAVQALMGESPVEGRLPITISAQFPFGSGLSLPQIRLRDGRPEEVGMDSRDLDRVDDILLDAIADSAFPGAAVAIGRANVRVKSRGYGYLTYTSDIPVTDETLFDLASLTKVVGTTTAIMKLYEEGKIRLDDPVQKYLPEFQGERKASITLKHLLTHTGGLRAYYPFHRHGITRSEEVLRFIYTDTLFYRPGEQMVYSDFDMILLGKIVEKITGQDLDTYLKNTFFRPMGMYDTGYLPVGRTRVDSTRIAPTEVDSTFRKRLVWGEVHDETAWILGGIAGHAGLFSTARDLSIFAQMLLNGGSYNGRQFLKPETIRLFTTPVDPEHHTRALGWDTKSPSGYSSAGRYFGPRSFGHTGFTGTSLWIDPDQQLYVILLTNRVYPTRANRKHIAVRPAVADAAYLSIEGPPRLLLPEPFDPEVLFD